MNDCLSISKSKKGGGNVRIQQGRKRRHKVWGRFDKEEWRGDRKLSLKNRSE